MFTPKVVVIDAWLKDNRILQGVGLIKSIKPISGSIEKSVSVEVLFAIHVTDAHVYQDVIYTGNVMTFNSTQLRPQWSQFQYWVQNLFFGDGSKFEGIVCGRFPWLFPIVNWFVSKVCGRSYPWGGDPY